MADRETNEAVLTRMLVEGAKVYIIVYTHRHGADAWLRIGMEAPDLEVEAAGLDGWEGEARGDYLEFMGPFDITDPGIRTLPVPVDRQFRNYYECDPCAQTWDSTWDSMCNDKCPKCNKEIEPYTSEPVHGN